MPDALFFCGIARNQTEMLDLFGQVFLLLIDDGTQMARLSTVTLLSRGVAHVIDQGLVWFRSTWRACWL